MPLPPRNRLGCDLAGLDLHARSWSQIGATNMVLARDHEACTGRPAHSAVPCPRASAVPVAFALIAALSVQLPLLPIALLSPAFFSISLPCILHPSKTPCRERRGP